MKDFDAQLKGVVVFLASQGDDAKFAHLLRKAVENFDARAELGSPPASLEWTFTGMRIRTRLERRRSSIARAVAMFALL
jgi:hypothetical protein